VWGGGGGRWGGGGGGGGGGGLGGWGGGGEGGGGLRGGVGGVVFSPSFCWVAGRETREGSVCPTMLHMNPADERVGKPETNIRKEGERMKKTKKSSEQSGRKIFYRATAHKGKSFKLREGREGAELDSQ